MVLSVVIFLFIDSELQCFEVSQLREFQCCHSDFCPAFGCSQQDREDELDRRLFVHMDPAQGGSPSEGMLEGGLSAIQHSIARVGSAVNLIGLDKLTSPEKSSFDVWQRRAHSYGIRKTLGGQPFPGF